MHHAADLLVDSGREESELLNARLLSHGHKYGVRNAKRLLAGDTGNLKQPMVNKYQSYFLLSTT